MLRRSLLHCTLALAASSAGLAAAPPGKGPDLAPAERAKVEAAIVYNMLQFVEWPDEAALGADSGFKLCIDTASPMYPVAQQLNDKPLRKMKLSVQPLDGTPASCRALFVDTPASLRAATIAGVREPVLIVASSRFDAAETATVWLLDADGRLAFDISHRKARQAGLQVSSRLLRLARKVVE